MKRLKERRMTMWNWLLFFALTIVVTAIGLWLIRRIIHKEEEIPIAEFNVDDFDFNHKQSAVEMIETATRY